MDGVALINSEQTERLTGLGGKNTISGLLGPVARVEKALFKFTLEKPRSAHTLSWPRKSLQGVEFDTENLLIAFDEVASLPETPEAH